MTKEMAYIYVIENKTNSVVGTLLVEEDEKQKGLANWDKANTAFTQYVTLILGRDDTRGYSWNDCPFDV